MIDPVILEHFRSMKERDELDAILPEILTGMGLEVLSRAKTGVRQYGADIAAVGKDEGGKRKLFLFSVKRGDLSRNEWNGPSEQALRPSLDEIRDAYVRTVAPQHKKLPVIIVLVVGGIVPENVLPLVNGYMDENEDDRFAYRLWTGDTLSKLVLEGVLREEIFPPARRAMLRKTAALVEEPDMALRHYGVLLDEVLADTAASAVERARILLVANWVIFSWGREAGNLEVPYEASEQLVLRAWTLLYPIIEQDRSRKKPASHVYFAIVNLHLEVWEAYIGAKVLPHAGTLHALSFAVGSVEPVDINLALFDVTGKVASGGLLKLWLALDGPGFPGIADGAAPAAHAVAKALALMHASNPTLQAPMLDQHSTDLGLAVLLLCCFGDTREAARFWIHQAAQALMISVSMPGSGPRFPSIDPSYETLIREVRAETEEERKDASAASTLLPLYGLSAWVLGDHGLVEELAEFQHERMEHTNAQGWVPNARCDDKMWQGHQRVGSALQDLKIGEGGERLIEALMRECEENTAWQDLSAIRLGHWPLVALACRRNTTPLPPQLWLDLINSAKAEAGP